MDNVLVTGASRGIGLAIARALARDGYRVLAVSREAGPEFEAAAAAAHDEGRGALVFRSFDLADVDGLASLVSSLKSEHGPIFGLVNNAGVSAEGLLPTLHNTQIERVLRINTLAPIVLTKFAVRGMLAQGRGRVVSISSIAAETGFRALSVYAASKAALVGFTHSLARDVGSVGVTVNAIAPGFIDTQMTSGMQGEARARIVRRSALRRLADVEDVAEAVAFLMSEKARNITGTVLTVDAGSTA